MSETPQVLLAHHLKTLNTGRRHGLSAFQAIQATINGEPLFRPG